MGLNKDQALSFYRKDMYACVLPTKSYAIYQAQDEPLNYSLP